jgi:hypothetical protein
MSNSCGPVESLDAGQLRAELGIHVGEWSTSSDWGAELQIGDGPMVSLSRKQAVQLARVLFLVTSGRDVRGMVRELALMLDGEPLF